MSRFEEEQEFAEVDCIYLTHTPGAVLIKADNVEHWIPRSQLSNDDVAGFTRGEVITLHIAEWLAKREGLI